MCGIGAVYSKNKQTEDAISATKRICSFLEHRGSDDLAFRNFSRVCIGHSRYKTSKNASKQPYNANNFSLVVNGQVTNNEEDTNYIFELLQSVFNSDMESSYGLLVSTAHKLLAAEIEGDYSLAVVFDNGCILGLRDPLGMRPLFYANNREYFAVASEDSALLREGLFNPGEVWEVPKNAVIFYDSLKNIVSLTGFDSYEEDNKTAHCHFEWVYFLNRASKFSGVSAHKLRYKLGQELAKNDPIRTLAGQDETVVIPVPYSGKDAAKGYVDWSSLPFVEGMEKQRNGKRTFITGKEDRDASIKDKYMYLPELTKDKICIVVDDSIVRGNTMKSIAKGLKVFGEAKEVHFRSSCPKITNPCPYAIDFHTKEELYLYNHMFIPSYVDSIHWNSLEDFLRVFEYFNVDRSKLCLGCLTGEYPHG